MKSTFHTQTVRMQFFSDTGFEDMEILQVPEYRQIYKAVLKYEIQTLLQKLSDTGEESVVLTASIHDDSATQLGSVQGKDFLQSQANLQGQFLCFCKDKLKGHGSKLPREIVSYESTGRMGPSPSHPNVVKQKPDATLKSAISRASECTEIRTADPLRSTSVTPTRPQPTLETPRSKLDKRDNSNKGRELPQAAPVETEATEKDAQLIPRDLIAIKKEFDSDQELYTTDSDLLVFHGQGPSPTTTAKLERFTIPSSSGPIINPCTSSSFQVSNFESIHKQYEQPASNMSTMINLPSGRGRKKRCRNLSSDRVSRAEKFIVSGVGNYSHGSNKDLNYTEPGGFSEGTSMINPVSMEIMSHDQSPEVQQHFQFQENQHFPSEQMKNYSISYGRQYLQTENTSAASAPEDTNIKQKSVRTKYCVICNRYVSGSYYSVHMNFHSGKRPHKCTVCGRQFTVTHDLRKHMRIHTGEMPFTCSICGRAFRDNSNYNKHLKRH